MFPGELQDAILFDEGEAGAELVEFGEDLGRANGECGGGGRDVIRSGAELELEFGELRCEEIFPIRTRVLAFRFGRVVSHRPGTSIVSVHGVRRPRVYGRHPRTVR